MTDKPVQPVDPLLAPEKSLPQTPLLVEDEAPLRPSLLHFNPTKQHMENLDALRILCMLVIIVTHVTEPYVDALHGSPEKWGWLYRGAFALNVACRFGVPCFMMISFYIYWHQLYDKGRSWGELLVRRLKRLIPAFVSWSLIYVVIHRGLKKFTGDAYSAFEWLYNLKLTSVEFWKHVLLLGRAETHLYYLPMVMTCLLLIPLLKVLWHSAAVSWTFIGLMVTAWVVVYYGSCVYPETSGAGKVIYLVFHNWQDFVAIPLLVFPVMGMMSAGQRPWREFIAKTPGWMWAALLVFGIALHVTETLVLLHYSTVTQDEGMAGQRWLVALAGLKPGRFITAVAVFVLVLRRPLMKDPFPRVSHHAFGLHFMHPIIILALTLVEKQLLGAALWEQWVVPMLAVNLLITFYATFGLCLLISRVKWLEFLVV